MRAVCDTSAILAGLVGEENFTTSDVLAEIRDFNSRGFVESLIFSKKLFIFDPQPSFTAIVREARERTGDDLSLTDISVIALALELDAVLFTNDYGIQNVCAFLGLKFENLSGYEIKEPRKWGYVCEGCGKAFERKKRTCDFCGNRIRKRLKEDAP